MPVLSQQCSGQQVIKFNEQDICKLNYPQINNNTDRTPDFVFLIFKGFSFTITLRQKPKGVPRRQRLITIKTQREHAHVEKPLNLENTTSSVLSALLLIYGITEDCVTPAFHLAISLTSIITSITLRIGASTSNFNFQHLQPLPFSCPSSLETSNIYFTCQRCLSRLNNGLH